MSTRAIYIYNLTQRQTVIDVPSVQGGTQPVIVPPYPARTDVTAITTVELLNDDAQVTRLRTQAPPVISVAVTSGSDDLPAIYDASAPTISGDSDQVVLGSQLFS